MLFCPCEKGRWCGYLIDFEFCCKLADKPVYPAKYNGGVRERHPDACPLNPMKVMHDVHSMIFVSRVFYQNLPQECNNLDALLQFLSEQEAARAL
jgi:hypothetical protein